MEPKKLRFKWRSTLLMSAALTLIALFVLAPAALASSPPAQGQQPAATVAVAPDTQVDVIVQTASSFPGILGDIKTLVWRLGGEITQELWIINGFAATVPAGSLDELSAYPGIKWVSLDGEMMKTATTAQFTTWATEIGTSQSSRYTDPRAAVDSPLGPNGTFFAAGDNTTSSLTGFSAEITPGNAITKVEVVLTSYLWQKLYPGKDLKISVALDGTVNKVYTYGGYQLNWAVGARNVKAFYLDVTNARAWTWADFERALEIKIQQPTQWFGDNYVYYDAIGLRVTSASGSDPSADAVPSDTEPVGAITVGTQLNVYNDVIRSTSAWNQQGYLQGNKVAVAVVDSGVIKTQDLGRRNKKNVNFNPAYHRATDVYGHGTFVAGIIAGNGKSSDGKYIGVAPKVNLVNVRVSDDQGRCNESDVVAGLQWVLENNRRYNIRVVNLSLNSAVAQSYQTSPLDAAVEVLWFNKIAVVTSAGNKGTATLFPPANDPFVITVGATDDKGTVSVADDTVAGFSSYGMSEAGLAKPELVAPGTKIVGLLPDNDKLTMSKNKPQNRINSTYFVMSGTSVSAPMVSGAIALLLQDEPNLTPDQVKYRLMATANKNWPGYDPAMAGAGYLDIYAAVKGTTTESANTNLLVSGLLTTGDNPVEASRVMWNSVMWNSVMWNSVMWNSVMWNSVMWNSDYWE